MLKRMKIAGQGTQNKRSGKDKKQFWKQRGRRHKKLLHGTLEKYMHKSKKLEPSDFLFSGGSVNIQFPMELTS